jgi:molybdopterin-guanine dinucleotide biosynthesis protein A
MQESVTGVILAGGSSRRMGTDKSLLDLGGKPIIGHVIDVLTESFSRVFIITNDPKRYARFGLPTMPDIIYGTGVLGGIHAGLYYLRDDAAFFVASDMPFIKPAVIDYLIGAFHDTDAVVPCLAGKYEPLLAVYSKECLTTVEKALAGHKRRPVDFLAGVQTRMVSEDELYPVDPGLISTFNVNTPEDYRKARLIIAEGEGDSRHERYRMDDQGKNRLSHVSCGPFRREGSQGAPEG